MNLSSVISTLRYMEYEIGNGVEISASLHDGFLILRAQWDNPKNDKQIFVLTRWLDEIIIGQIRDDKDLIETFIKDCKSGYDEEAT